MFLEYNGLDSLREDSILIANVFLSHTTLVVLINELFGHWRKSTIVCWFKIKAVIKELLLLIYSFLFTRVVELIAFPFKQWLCELFSRLTLILNKFFHWILKLCFSFFIGFWWKLLHHSSIIFKEQVMCLSILFNLVNINSIFIIFIIISILFSDEFLLKFLVKLNITIKPHSSSQTLSSVHKVSFIHISSL